MWLANSRMPTRKTRRISATGFHHFQTASAVSNSLFDSILKIPQTGCVQSNVQSASHYCKINPKRVIKIQSRSRKHWCIPSWDFQKYNGLISCIYLLEKIVVHSQCWVASERVSDVKHMPNKYVDDLLCRPLTRADESKRDLLEKIVGSLNSALFSFAEAGARQRPPPRRDLTIVSEMACECQER